jgi:hypothetical protein
MRSSISAWAVTTLLLANSLLPVGVLAKSEKHDNDNTQPCTDANDIENPWWLQEKYDPESRYKKLKEISRNEASLYKKFEKYLQTHNLKEPIAKPLDPRMPNMTLLLTRFGRDDCSTERIGHAEIINATAVPVCFEFPDHEHFGSVSVNWMLSNPMAWDESGGVEGNAKCRMVMYGDKTCHGPKRFQAYRVCSSFSRSSWGLSLLWILS